MDHLADLAGESPAIEAVRTEIRRLVGHRTTGRRLPSVLLQGETGTGKGLVARVLHRAGPRAAGPFVDVNCAAIPETLLEAELFGFERGAFTDARRSKPGLLQAAHRGTIFLDEVGLLPVALQAKLLTVIEEQMVRRLGATQAEPVDVWVVSATNADLRSAMRDRRFREDLYHRLAVLTLELPPLRERGRDVLLLAERFLAQGCEEYGLPLRRFNRDAEARLLTYAWPGNVRELANVVERVVLTAEGETITAQMLSLEPGLSSLPADVPPAPVAAEEATRERLRVTLEQTGWNISRTAAILGLSRNTVRARIERFALRPDADTATSRSAAAGAQPEGARPVARDRAESSPLRAAAPTTPPPSGIRWDRRPVTLMRVRLVASTDADELLDTSRALEQVVDKVQAFGGRVEALDRTGVDVAFGLDSIEEAPRRAANAALAIQKAAERQGNQARHTFALKVAIHAGSYMVGDVGGRSEIEQTAAREVAAILDALLAESEPAAIVVSGPTVPFLERRFKLAPADATGHARRVLGREGSGLGLWGRLGQFVGRRQELELLENRWAAARRGSGQIVGLVGEPGVGKSRLLWELIHERPRPDCLLLEVAAVALATPYLPMIELVRRYFWLEAGEDAERVREKVRTAINALDPAFAPIVPPLLALLDVAPDDGEWPSLDPRQRRQRIIDALKALFLRESRRQPVLLVCEDAHWIDSESQAVLDALGEGIPTARLLLLITYRPEYQHRWGNKTFFSQLRVDPLDADQARDLLRGWLGDEPSLAELAGHLIDWTEGNPLFLEELVRTLVEIGTLVGERGSYRLVTPVTAIRVPATVEEVLGARIDRLPPGQRELLQSAAVIGRDVPQAVLAGVTGLPDPELRERLGELREAEFLYETATFPEAEYTFKHALTHEVAYQSLPGDRRRALHARSVHVVETVYAGRLEEQVEHLAHHAFEGQLWAAATEYLRHAGTRAFERFANREAAARFFQALQALAHLPETRQRLEEAIDLRFELRNALTPLGEARRTLESLQEARGLAERIGDARRLGRALAFETNARYLVGEFAEAMATGHRAHETAAVLGNFALETATAMYLGRALHALGEYRRAIDVLRPVVISLVGARAQEHLGLPVLPAVFARSHLVLCLGEVGEFEEALRVAQEGIALAEATGHPDTLLWAHRGAGLLHLTRGDWPAAVRGLGPALAIARENQLAAYVSPLASALGFALAHEQQLAAGLALLEEAVESAVNRKQVANEALVAMRLATGYLLAERLDRAEASVRRALELSRTRRERGVEAYALHVGGQISARQGRGEWPTAEARYTEALRGANDLGMRPLAARCRVALGELLLAGGDRATARAHAEAAVGDLRGMGMTALLAHAHRLASGLD